MAFNAYDVKIVLWKMLKLTSKSSVKFISKHPVVSVFLLCLFLLYMSFPSFFWVFLYCFPPFVVITTIFRIYISLRNGKNCNKAEKTEGACSDKSSKSMTRVHSVRRRRAINIQREDGFQGKVEEKTAVYSTSFSFEPMVDKNAVIEEIPKEIQEVKVNSSLVDDSAKVSSLCSSQSLKPEFGEGSQIQSLEGSEDEEEGQREDGDKASVVQWTEEDQKNVMDVGMSESERNKRLESLIARRKSRKLLSLQVRRTLMNIDRNDPPSQLTSLVIPKSNKNSFPTSSTFDSRFSPSPGSAPSILVPMRNPFDLPYDPHEEKPDLTGDSFQQEFFTPSQHKDMMFCRHESFSLGGFLPGELNQSREKASFFNDIGFRQNGSSQDYHITQLGGIFDKGLTTVVNQGPTEVSKPESTIDTEVDQIKEVIQVHRNDTETHAEEKAGEVYKEPFQNENFNAMSSASHERGTNTRDKEDIDKSQDKPISEEGFNTTSSSSSSSEDEAPYFKIDKEAVLRSLSSLARRNVVQVKETNDKIEDPLSLDEHLFYANKTMKHHYPSYSIASDLQVEVSDISSPPLTIDENFTSYEEDILMYETMDMEKKASLGSEYLWEGSSNIFGVEQNGSSSRQLNEVRERDVMEVGYSTIKKSEERNLSNPIEDKVFEEHFVNQPSSLPTVSELRDGGKVINHAVLNENIAETSQKSLSSDSLEAIFPKNSVISAPEASQQSTREVVTLPSHGNSSRKQIENIRSSEDFGERLKSITEHEKSLTMPALLDNHGNLATNQHDAGEASSSSRTTLNSNYTTMSSNNPQPLPLMQTTVVEQTQVVQSSSSSPKSVLQPAFSLDNLSSFDHDNYQEIHQFSRNMVEALSPTTSQILTPLTEHSTTLSPYGRDVAKLQESAESSGTSSRGAREAHNSIESANKQALHENSAKLKEVASSSLHGLNSHDTPVELLKPVEEPNSGCIKNDDMIPSKNLEAAYPATISKSIDAANNSKSPLSTSEESNESSRMSTVGFHDSNESANKRRHDESGAKFKQVGSSSQHVLSNHETSIEQLKPIEETSSRGIKNNDAAPSKNVEPAHPIEIRKNKDEVNNSRSPISTNEESATSSRTSTREVHDHTEFANKERLHESGAELKEVGSSNEHVLSNHETSIDQLKSIEATSLRGIKNDEAHQAAIKKDKDEVNNLRSPLSTNVESTESSRILRTGAERADSAELTNKQQLHENSAKLKEIASNSLHVLSICDAPAQLIEEPSLRCIKNYDTIPSKTLEAAHPITTSKNIVEANNSKSPQSTNEELPKSSGTSTRGVVDSIGHDTKQKLLESSTKSKEVGSSSKHVLNSTHDTSVEQLKPIEETSTRCIKNDDGIHGKNPKAEHSTAASKNIGVANNSDSRVLSANEESIESSRTTIQGADSSAKKPTLHENNVKLNEDASSSLEVLSVHERPDEALKPSSRSMEINVAIPSKTHEAVHPSVISKTIDESSKSPPIATHEERSKYQEKVTEKSVIQTNINTLQSRDNPGGNSDLQKESAQKHESDNHSDRKGGTTSTSPNCSEKTKDEVQTTNTVQTTNPRSATGQENENSETEKKTEHDTKGNQHVNSHESVSDDKKKS